MAVQTQIQTRRGTAASWTSTNPTLAAGEIGFESDTNKFKIGTGSTAWASLAYASNVSPLTTKGDLYTYSTDNTRLAVGANGETIVADSSTSTGLRYQGSQAAGKNLVINGGMDIWQRGTSFTNNTSYSADRWAPHRSGFATGLSVSRQTVTSSDVGGSARYSMQFGRASGDTSTAAIFNVQPIESAMFTQYAGQTMTFSLWVKAGANYSGGSTIGLTLFSGTADFTVGGGGGTTTAFAGTSPTITTSWTRVTLTGTVPSTGVGGMVQIAYTPSGTAGANDWVQITGVQYELGSVATTFTRAGGTIQGELAAASRYYWRVTGQVGANNAIINGISASTTNALVPIQNPVVMRVLPTSVDYSGVSITNTTSYTTGSSSVTIENGTPFAQRIQVAVTGQTANQPVQLVLANGGYLGFSAEL